MTEVALEDLPAELRQKAALADKDVPRPVDYFAATETVQHMFPDGVQFVVIKVLNEGERRRYLSKTNSEVRMNQRSKELTLRGNAANDLHALLETAIADWYVVRGGQPLGFTTRVLQDALDAWPPALIDEIAEAVRDLNPWLRGTEEDLEALRDEREALDRRITELEAKALKS